MPAICEWMRRDGPSESTECGWGQCSNDRRHREASADHRRLPVLPRSSHLYRIGPILKKLARSTQVLFPAAVDTKFAVHEWFHRRTGRIFKPGLEGLRHFDFGGRLLVDVGANHGQSIVAFKNAAPGCRIIAFEPNRLLADRLTASYSCDPKVHIEPCALSDKEGSLTLYIPSYRGYLFDGLASISPDTAKWFNRGRLYFFDSTRVSVQTSVVPARKLDSYGLRPALIKLSAQRAEIEILLGAETTIGTHQPIVIAVWAWAEEIAILRGWGYRPYGYSGKSFRDGAIGEYTWFLLPHHIETLNPARVELA